MLHVKLIPNKNQQKALRTYLQEVPSKIKRKIELKWNIECINFIALMQDKHLNAPPGNPPNPFVDQLRRQSSNLFNSLTHEVRMRGLDVGASVWFLDAVSDYAPTHEFGDSSRNIPARMNLRKEWDAFKDVFWVRMDEAVDEGLA